MAETNPTNAAQPTTVDAASAMTCFSSLREECTATMIPPWSRQRLTALARLAAAASLPLATALPPLSDDGPHAAVMHARTQAATDAGYESTPLTAAVVLRAALHVLQRAATGAAAQDTTDCDSDTIASRNNGRSSIAVADRARQMVAAALARACCAACDGLLLLPAAAAQGPSLAQKPTAVSTPPPTAVSPAETAAPPPPARYPQVVDVAGQRYHASCLHCSICSAQLAGQALTVAESGPVCLGCAPACATCGRCVDGSAYVACLGRSYHQKCLRCGCCHELLLPTLAAPVFERDGHPACLACVQNAFAPRLTRALRHSRRYSSASRIRPQREEVATAAADSMPPLDEDTLRRFAVYGTYAPVQPVSEGADDVYTSVQHYAACGDVQPGDGVNEQRDDRQAIRRESGDPDALAVLFQTRADAALGMSHEPDDTGSQSSDDLYSDPDAGSEPGTGAGTESAEARLRRRRHSSSHASTQYSLDVIVESSARCAQLVDFCAQRRDMLEPLLLWMDLEQFATLPPETTTAEVTRTAHGILRKYLTSSSNVPTTIPHHVRHRAMTAVMAYVSDCATSCALDDPTTQKLVLELGQLRHDVRRIIEARVLPAFAASESEDEPEPEPEPEPRDAASGKLTPEQRQRFDDQAGMSPPGVERLPQPHNSLSMPWSAAVTGFEKRSGFVWQHPLRSSYVTYIVCVEVEPSAADAPSLPPYRIRRRFREFCGLHNLIQSELPCVPVAEFPRRLDRLIQSPSVLCARRQAALNTYLASILAVRDCWTLEGVRAFFQPRLDDRIGWTAEPPEDSEQQ